MWGFSLLIAWALVYWIGLNVCLLFGEIMGGPGVIPWLCSSPGNRKTTREEGGGRRAIHIYRKEGGGKNPKKSRERF